MRTALLTRSTITALGAGLVLAACSEGPPTAPASAAKLQGPSLNVVTAVAATAVVCAEGPAGSYGYAMAVSGGVPANQTLPLGTSFSLNAGQCATVLQISAPADPALDPLTTVTITQNAAPSGTQLDSIERTQEGQPDDVLLNTSSASLNLNFFHGAVASFWNSASPPPPPPPPAGCTFTLGYWKNHTSSWPSGAPSPDDLFFNTGLTYLEVLSSPSKTGDANLILGRQYIAALLNMDGGTSAPAAVMDAFNSATAYFNGGSATRDQLIAWATILDNYNNGLAPGGPNHCG